MMTAMHGPGAVAAAEEVFLVVRDTRSGFVKDLSMRSAFPTSGLAPVISAYWERGVCERLAHSDVMVALGDGRRFVLNYRCTDLGCWR